MIPSLHRFHRRNHVQRVLTKGLSVRGRQLSIRYKILDDQPYRVAVVVSKKVSKKAVIRNKIRRRVFSIIRENKNLIPAGAQIVVGVYDEKTETMPYAELSEQTISLLKKIT